MTDLQCLAQKALQTRRNNIKHITTASNTAADHRLTHGLSRKSRGREGRQNKERLQGQGSFMSFYFLLQERSKNDCLKKTANTRQLAGLIVAIEEGSFGMVKSMADRKIYTSLYNALRDYLSKAKEDS